MDRTRFRFHLRQPVPTGLRPRPLSGQSMVEFALISTVLLTFIIGTFEFGIAFWKNGTVDYAAREGARQLSVSSASVDSDQDMLEKIGQAMWIVGVQQIVGIKVQKLCPKTATANDATSDSNYTYCNNNPNSFANYLNNLRCSTDPATITHTWTVQRAAPPSNRPVNCSNFDQTSPTYNPNFIADYHTIDCVVYDANGHPDTSQPTPCNNTLATNGGNKIGESWQFRAVNATDPTLLQMGLVQWPPRNPANSSVRGNCSPTDVFRIDITLKHTWVTGLVPGGQIALSDGTRMRLEPHHFSTYTSACS